MNIKKIITSAAVLSVMAFSAAPATKNIVPMLQPTAITASAARIATYTDVDKFFNDYNGKYVDVDGCYGCQCVDFAALYMSKVCGINSNNPANNTFNGYEYWTWYNSSALLNGNFKRISNTSSFVPQKGDIVVWSQAYSKYGHVAVCTGEGNTNYFYSYDQNCPTGSKVHKVRHDYSCVYGVLRYKNMQDNTNPSDNEKVEYNANGEAQFDTLWVENRTYSFTKKKTVYATPNRDKPVGYVQKGDKVKFVKYVRYGRSILGETADGNYVPVNTIGELNVNAYVIVNCKTLNVRKKPNKSSSIINTVSINQTYLVSKTCNDWGYVPSLGGWIDLRYVRG